MLLLQGEAALSPFRIEKLRAGCADKVPGVTSIEARHLFVAWFVDSQAMFSKECSILCDLTRAKPITIEEQDLAPALFTTPRIGTISPWSSKATDICRNCAVTGLTRLERVTAWYIGGISERELQHVAPLLHDRMTETVMREYKELSQLNSAAEPANLNRIPLNAMGRTALDEANTHLGLALNHQEIDYLLARYNKLGREPTDAELMMFAQANSEHCRHKIFNASWSVDGIAQKTSLFEMIRNTYEANPNGVLSAYRDNAAVGFGYRARRFYVDGTDGVYVGCDEDMPIVMKVETHNHPTAISPFSGASTGVGGEIRDEGATGRGAKPKAGLSGFTVSHLRIPGVATPWEATRPLNPRLASAFEIMLHGPVGAASFSNEFGRPTLVGYFRTFEYGQPNSTILRGYDKPIMLAGGLGNIRPTHVNKEPVPTGAAIVVLGGPAMLIGLGGGAASSLSSGSIDAELDYASVQRENPEMQRRCQQVIDACWAAGDANPIQVIHDVGAGGLSNAIPEILFDGKRGGVFALRDIPSADPRMSPLEVWCNEAQERYVLAIKPEDLKKLTAICERERCPYAVVGHTTLEQKLVVNDALLGTPVIDIPMDVIFGNPPRMNRKVDSVRTAIEKWSTNRVPVDEAVERVLQFPSVGDKRFLITIGDRSVGGLSARDQMVGPWQVPVADYSVTLSAFDDVVGEAMAVGERTQVALLEGPASARLAVGEAITNLAGARIKQLSNVVLSANWMCPAGYAGEDARLYDMVSAVGIEFCPSLGINIPVGKDSMSMHSSWQAKGQTWRTIAPTSLIVSAFAPVMDVRCSLTPDLRDIPDTALMLFDLGRGRNRLGGSILAQCWSSLGGHPPDCDEPSDLADFFRAVQILNDGGYLLAYHDRSDGGMLATLAEMAFAGRLGVSVDVTTLGKDPVAALFSEELGAIVQVRISDIDAIQAYVRETTKLHDCVHIVAQPTEERSLRIINKGHTIFHRDLYTLLKSYTKTTHAMQRARDNPSCADQEIATILDRADPGLSFSIPQANFDRHRTPLSFKRGTRPRVAILREQGVNGHVEMAAAFDRAGFEAIDVHMTDILSGRQTLRDITGMAACGGFSYGDVLGAGRGWASSIRLNSRAQTVFEAFFQRPNTFTLGVCNGCQMLSNLKELIPGAADWPTFERNASEQFEARLVMVEVLPSRSILMAGLEGLCAPIVVAHGEGRVVRDFEKVTTDEDVCLRYVDNHKHVTESYPYNPNGSPRGLTGLTTYDGRVTIMMPHPERVFLRKQFSWCPQNWRDEESPWMALFNNAKRWVDNL